MSNKYLVFSGWKDREGGVHDFNVCFDSLKEAMDWGENTSGLLEDTRLSSWLHIAELNLATNQLKIVAILALPETEYYSWHADDEHFAVHEEAEYEGEPNEDGEFWHWRAPMRKG